MSTVVGSATVELLGDASQYTAEFEGAARTLHSMGSRLQSVGMGLTKFVTVPLMAAAGGAVALATRVGSLADELTDLSEMTGLSTDALQEFRRVATVAGVGQDEVGLAAEALTRKLRGAGEESKVVQGALDHLGVRARDAGGELRSMDALLPDIIHSLQNTQNVTERNALAVQLFGRRALELAPILGLTVEQFDAARREAHDLGLVLSGEALQSADQFRLQVDTLKQSLGAAAAKLGVALLPAVKTIADVVSRSVLPPLTALVEKIGKLSPDTVRWALAIGAVVAVLGPAVALVGSLATGAAALATVLGVSLLPLVAVGAPLIVGLGLLAALFVKNKLMAADAQTEVMSLAEAMNTLSTATTMAGTNQIITAMDTLLARRAELASRPLIDNAAKRQIAIINIELLALRDRYIEIMKAAAAARAATGDTGTTGGGGPLAAAAADFSALDAAMAGLSPELAAISTQFATVGAGLGAINPGIQTATEGTYEWTNATLLLADGFAIVGQQAADALLSIIGHANRAGEAFKNFGKAVLNEIARMIAKFIAMKAVSTLLNALFPGAGTSFEAMAGIGARAAGGPVMRNQPYLVGEKGPELFVPRSSGRITPNHQLALAGGGTLRLDLASLPPRPAAVTPDALATDDWWRMAFGRLKLDYDERGGL